MTNFDNYPGTLPAAAYAHGTESVGDTAVLLCTPSGPGGVVVQNNTGTAVTVYLGGAGVTATGATAGYALAQNATVTIPTFGFTECELYAITASGTASVAFLYPAQ